MTGTLQAIDSWAEVWSQGLWRASWQAALLIVVAVAIARWRAHVSSRVMCWVWRLICIKTLIAFVWLSPLLIPILPAQPVETIAERPDSQILVANGKTLPSETNRPAAPNPVAQADDSARALSWRSLLMSLWLAGVLIGVGATLKQWIAIARLRHATSPVEFPELQETLRQEAERLGIRRPPGLRQGSNVSGTMLAGIWSPCIMLPALFSESFNAGERRLMLAHELVHLKRRDLAWNWLASIVGWLFFFHPLVWLLRRQWGQEQELACDEMLIERGGISAADYGRMIVKLAASGPRETSSEFVAAYVVGSYRNLERRIRALGEVHPSSSRRLILAAVLLACVGPALAVPWRLVASEVPPDVKAQAPAANAPSSQTPKKPVDLHRLTSVEPDVIIALHVLLMNNEIVTWDQVVSRLRVLRRSGPIHANFHFTNGVSNSQEKEAGWQAWHNRVMGLYRELFEPAGVSLGSLSPPAGERYDAIRTAADLRPDPARARTGFVLTPFGRPAVGAQVVVVPPGYLWGLTLQGTELRDPLDEQWVSTDATGQFTAYPKEDSYRIVCLHPSGFAMQSGVPKGGDLVLRLQPWATVRFLPANEPADQSTDLTATPSPREPGDSLQFQIFSIRSQGKPLDIKVPSGKIVASRSLRLQNGTGVAIPVDSFTVAPGGLTTVTIEPATDADRTRAKETYENLEKLRKGGS